MEVFMIYETYIKEKKIIDYTNKEKDLDLIKCLIRTKGELELANKNYEFAEDELVDYYAYQIKANQTKLDYLIKKAQKKGLALDMINEIYIRKNKA